MTTSLFGLPDLKHPLEFVPSQPLTRERFWEIVTATSEELAVQYPVRRPVLSAKAIIDRRGNQRKLKTAQRMLKNATNESQRAMARASVAMLQEMLRT